MPSYQFNHFTGRLRESTQFQPLYPISATPLQTSEPPKMIWDTAKTKPVMVSNIRSKSGGGVLSEKMLKTFEEYQRKIDTPVYKIRGTPDKILLGITTGLLAFGLVWAFSFLGRRAFPPKSQ